MRKVCSYKKNVPLRGMRPFCISTRKFLLHKKLQAFVVRKHTLGTPISSAAATANDIMASETVQVTGGMPSASGEELSFTRSWRNGAKPFSLRESQRDGMCWVVSESACGRPSGIVSKWKSGELLPAAPDFCRRRWLYSVLTKVM